MDIKKVKSGTMAGLAIFMAAGVGLAPVTDVRAGELKDEINVYADSQKSGYRHTYHTNVKGSAEILVKYVNDDGTVYENKNNSVNYESGFIAGNVSDEQIKAELEAYHDKVYTALNGMHDVKLQNSNKQLIFDHFESSNILDDETQGESGQNVLDVHEYQIYQVNESYEASVRRMNTVSVDGATVSYSSKDKPAAAAKAAGTNAEGFDVACEGWEKMEKTDYGLEPSEFWYSDDSRDIPSAKRLTEFEEGSSYIYSLVLKAKDGYCFADDVKLKLNGKDTKYGILTVSSDKKTCYCEAVVTLNVKAGGEEPGSKDDTDGEGSAITGDNDSIEDMYDDDTSNDDSQTGDKIYIASGSPYAAFADIAIVVSNADSGAYAYAEPVKAAIQAAIPDYRILTYLNIATDAARGNISMATPVECLMANPGIITGDSGQLKKYYLVYCNNGIIQLLPNISDTPFIITSPLCGSGNYAIVMKK